MCSMDEAKRIVNQMSENIRSLFPQERPDVILFGSYARNMPEDGSDIDVMYLVDASRQEIADKNWQIGAAAANLLLLGGPDNFEGDFGETVARLEGKRNDDEHDG